jgi:hypothetical protein
MNHGRRLAGLLLAGALAGAVAIGLGGSAQATAPPPATETINPVTVGAGPGVAPPGETGPATNRIGSYYMIVNQKSQKCADVQGKSFTFGAKVHQWGCKNDTNQVWTLEPIAGTPYFNLRNFNSSWCMQVKSSAAVPANGTGIQQGYCSTTIPGSQWKLDVLVPNGNDTVYQISSRAGGVCLDLNDGTDDDNGKIQTWTCQGPFNNHQWWQFR